MGQKVRKLPEGATLEVGDKIKAEHMGLGVDWYTVSRVTPKFAFTHHSVHSESKFPREHLALHFEPIPRNAWGTTNYSAWRPV